MKASKRETPSKTRLLTHSSGIRPPADHGINRPDLHTPQGAQGTGTNRPKTYTQPTATTHPTNPTPPPTTPEQPQQNRVTAKIATGKRPDPSRTRKLSLPAPMILPNPGGKVGHRRTHTQKRAPTRCPFLRVMRPNRKASNSLISRFSPFRAATVSDQGRRRIR